jgi:hypothetical protein
MAKFMKEIQHLPRELQCFIRTLIKILSKYKQMNSLIITILLKIKFKIFGLMTITSVKLKIIGLYLFTYYPLLRFS